jgi:hypothetical protein
MESTMRRRWRLLAAMMVAALAPHCANAQDKTQFSAAHLAEAERLVYALGMVESLTIPTRRAIQQIRQSDPARADLMAAGMGPFLEKKYIGLGLRELMASQFDPETCRQLSEHWEGPVGRRFVNTQVQLLSTGKAPELKFTPEEEAMAKRFEKTAAFQAFARAQPAIQQGLAAYVKDTKEKMARKKMQDDAARRKNALDQLR